MTGRDAAPNLEGVLPLIEDSYEKILQSIVAGYGISRSEAERLYRHLWIYTHGLRPCASQRRAISRNRKSAI